VQILIWTLLSFLTFGLALIVMPYFFLRPIINSTYVVDEHGVQVGRLHVDFALKNVIEHALLWLLLTIITLGFAYFVFWVAALKWLLNRVTYGDLNGPKSLSLYDSGSPVMR